MNNSPAADAHAVLLDILEQSKGSNQATFSEPWMARAFGLVLTLSEGGLFLLKDFQAALIEAVGRREKSARITDESEYYTCWLEALMSQLCQLDLLPDEALPTIEKALVATAAARKEHQHHIARNPDGSLRLVPIVTD